MKWVENFQLFLFDFDGLLVDTEPLHFEAFKKMLEKNGSPSDLTYTKYLELAHANGTDLRDHTYGAFPSLYRQKPDWETLRQEKTVVYLELLKTEKLQLLPGVEQLLIVLNEQQKKRCVVTNSTTEQIHLIRQKLPLLNTIPVWICREDYRFPKPNPEGYLMAISRLAESGDRIVGFEDSLKGLKALQATPAKAVLITSREDIPTGITHFPSFSRLLRKERDLGEGLFGEQGAVL